MAVQELAQLLWQLKTGGHKALIFTQMTKMLDVLEAFLNLHGYTYLRLDGTTKPEQRQASPRFHLLELSCAPHVNLHGYTYLRRQASSRFHLLTSGFAPHGKLQDLPALRVMLLWLWLITYLMSFF